jgi:zinc-ribbon domain
MEIFVTFLIVIICAIGALLGVMLLLALAGVTAMTSLFVWTVRRLRGSSKAPMMIDSRPVKRCTNTLCGATNPDYANFCRRCGSSMTGTSLKSHRLP